MAGTVEQKLAAQGIVLPEPRAAMANYVGFVRSGNLLFISGQVCANAEGKLVAKGKLGFKSGEGFRKWSAEEQAALRAKVVQHLKNARMNES